jgi:hypothetical protein
VEDPFDVVGGLVCVFVVKGEGGRERELVSVSGHMKDKEKRHSCVSRTCKYISHPHAYTLIYI